MEKVKKNYNYILSFLILTMIMILGITVMPTDIYADDTDESGRKYADWKYYQNEDDDASTFEEMLDIEWEKFKKQTNNNPSISEKDFKSRKVTDLGDRIVIKYTLLKPDKFGRTFIYKTYRRSSTTGTGADYGEIFNYEVDWESNVEKIEVWLPCTVNPDSATVKNPEQLYKPDPENPDNIEGIGGYGGNYCMAWAGQFHNTLESQEEKELFISNGLSVYGGIGYWNKEHPIGSANVKWQPNLYNYALNYQTWKHYDPKKRKQFTFNYRDKNGNIIEGQQKSWVYGTQGSWDDSNQQINATDGHINFFIAIKVDNTAPKVGIFEEPIATEQNNIGDFTKYFKNANKLNILEKTPFVSSKNLYLNVVDLEAGLADDNIYKYYITDTNDAATFITNKDKYYSNEYIPEKSNCITLDLSDTTDTNYIWVPVINDIMGHTSNENKSGQDGIEYNLVTTSDGISYHVFGPYILNRIYTIKYDNGQTNCSYYIPDTNVASDFFVTSYLGDGSDLYGREYSISFALGEKDVQYSIISTPNYIANIEGHCNFSKLWEIPNSIYTNKLYENKSSIKKNLTNTHGDILTAIAKYNNAVIDLRTDITRGSYIFCGWKLADDETVQSSSNSSWTSTSPNGIVKIDNTIIDGKVTKSRLTVDGSKKGDNYLNINVIAVWKIQSDTLYFNYNGGIGDEISRTVTFGTSIGQLPATSYIGHILKSWTGENNEIWYDNAIWNLNAREYTLTANWEDIIYDIDYILDDGYWEEDANVKNSAKYSDEFIVPIPRKDGYTFKGWNITQMDKSEHIIDGISNYEESIELCTGTKYSQLYSTYEEKKHTVIFRAIWEENISKLVFIYNGGTPEEPISKELHYNKEIGELPTPTLKGHFFKGWYKEKIYKNLWSEEEKWRIIQTTTVEAYAKYEPIEYTINYDLGTGYFNNKDKVPTNAKYKEEIIIPNPENYGYHFVRWEITGYQETMEVNGNIYKNLRYEKGEVLFTAIWETDEYKIHCYDENGNHIEDVKVKYNEEIINIPNIPEKQGYDINGWHIEKGNKASTEYYNGMKYTLTKDINIYRVYTAITYNIKYDYPNGTMEKAPNKANYDEEIVISGVNRPGYSFDGWTITNNQDTTEIKGDTYKNLRYEKGEVTFIGNFTKYKYNIIYDYNVPSGVTVNNATDNPNKVEYDEIFEVKTPSRNDGYSFAGWTIEGMDNSTHYINGSYINNTTVTGIKSSQNATFKNLTGVNNATVTFKAAWIANDRLVTFFTEQGKMTGDTIIDNLWTIRLLKSGDTRFTSINKYGTTWGTDIPKVTRIGYNFNGYYYLNANGQKEMIYNFAYNKNTGNSIWDNSGKYKGSNALLIADWIAKHYKVTYHINSNIIGTYAGTWKDGTIIDKQLEVIYDSTQNSIGYKDSDVNKPGYSLSGWYIDKDGIEKIYTSNGECLNTKGYWSRDYVPILRGE